MRLTTVCLSLSIMNTISLLGAVRIKIHHTTRESSSGDELDLTLGPFQVKGFQVSVLPGQIWRRMEPRPCPAAASLTEESSCCHRLLFLSWSSQSKSCSSSFCPSSHFSECHLHHYTSLYPHSGCNFSTSIPTSNQSSNSDKLVFNITATSPLSSIPTAPAPGPSHHHFLLICP